MKARGIATGVHYMPLPLLDLFSAHDEPVPVALRVWSEFVTLPLFVDISDEEIDYVLEAVRAFAS
jgi:perosamine synthetase